MRVLKYFLIVAAFGSILCSCSDNKNQSNKIKIVKLSTVESASKQFSVEYPGKVRAAENIGLSFRVSGVLQKIYVKQGDYIKQGQLLAQLDPKDYKIQLDATQAEYNQIKAEAERVIALYKDGGTTPNMYDKAVYGLEQITAKYNHHKDQLSYTKLYAPFSGKVQNLVFREFETVGAGMPVISILNSGDLEVEINIPAAEYIKKDNFRSYECYFNYFPDKTFPLTPISVAPKANANQLYTVKLRLQVQKGVNITPGMVTMVRIGLDKGQNQMLQVPASAMFTENGNSYVYVYKKDSETVEKTQINMVQLLSKGTCVVTSKDLKLGDNVVALGVRHIEDGSKVKALPTESSTNIGGLL